MIELDSFFSIMGDEDVDEGGVIHVRSRLILFFPVRQRSQVLFLKYIGGLGHHVVQLTLEPCHVD